MSITPGMPPLQQISTTLNPTYYHPFSFTLSIESSGGSDNYQLDLGQAADLFVVSSNIDVYDTTSPKATRVLPSSSAVDPLLVTVLIGTNYNLVAGNSGITVWQYNQMWLDNYMQKGWIIGERYITMTVQHTALSASANFTFPLEMYVTLNGYKLTGEAR